MFSYSAVVMALAMLYSWSPFHVGCCFLSVATQKLCSRMNSLVTATSSGFSITRGSPVTKLCLTIGNA